MHLVEATRFILSLSWRLDVDRQTLDRADAEFLGALAACEGACEIREALSIDDEDMLAPDLRRKAYERLLELDGWRPGLLREFAGWLSLHYLAEDKVVERLLEEAESIERKIATER